MYEASQMTGKSAAAGRDTFGKMEGVDKANSRQRDRSLDVTR